MEKMTKKQQKPQKIDEKSKNNKYYCFNCGNFYEDIDNSKKVKACPRCGGILGKIIE